VVHGEPDRESIQQRKHGLERIGLGAHGSRKDAHVGVPTKKVGIEQVRRADTLEDDAVRATESLLGG